MFHNKLTRASLALAGTFLVLAATASTASAAQPEEGMAASAGRYCDVVVERVTPGSPETRVVSTVCGDTPRVRNAREILLMEWHEHANNSPPSLKRVTIEGDECDQQGYKISISGFWDNRISGFNTYSSCDFQIAYDLKYTGDSEQYYGGRHPWVGSKMNDRISSFRICRSVPCVG